MNASRVSCNQCGRAMGEDQEFCPWCGRAEYGLAAGGRDDVYLLIMQANLLRLRRRYPEAEAAANGAIQRNPRAAAPYSVMGDILRDQGKTLDAIEWYKMALDRDPKSQQDRRKLEDLIDLAYAPPPRGPLAWLKAQVCRWFGTACSEVQALRQSGLLAGIAAVAVLGALLVVVSVLLLGRGAGPDSAGADASVSTSGSFELQAVPQLSEPRPEPPAVDDQLIAHLAAAEQEALDLLRARVEAMDPTFQVESVELEPRTGVLSVRCSVLRLWMPSHTRARVLECLETLAAGVTEWGRAPVALRVRCEMRGPEGVQEVALLGEGPPEELAKLARGEAVSRVTGPSLWWHPELRESSEQRE